MEDRSAGEVVIDLGLREPPAEHPGLSQRQQWTGRGGHLRWLLTVVVLVTAGLVGGSAEPPGLTSAVVVPLSGVAYGRIQLVEDLVLTPKSNTEWLAYDAVTGAHRWSFTNTSSSFPEVLAAGDVVLQLSAGVARDAEAGSRMWNRSGIQALPGSGIGIVVEPGGESLAGDWQGPPPASELAGVDLATGEDRWRITLSDAQAWLVEGDQPTVVTTSAAGMLELRDLSTGVVLASQHAPSGGWRMSQPLGVQDGHLAVSWWQDERMSVRGYRTDDLEPVWDWSTAAEPFANAQLCGRVVCAITYEPLDEAAYRESTSSRQFIYGITTADGGVLRLVPQVTAVEIPTGQATPLGDLEEFRLADNRLLRYDPEGSLVDPLTPGMAFDLTGWRLLAEVSSWAPVGQLPRWLALVAEPADRPGAPVAVLDTATGELTEHAWVPGRPEHCLAAERRLACRYGAELHVWSW